jgi:hypothetical protein
MVLVKLAQYVFAGSSEEQHTLLDICVLFFPVFAVQAKSLSLHSALKPHMVLSSWKLSVPP